MVKTQSLAIKSYLFRQMANHAGRDIIVYLERLLKRDKVLPIILGRYFIGNRDT